MCGAGEGDPASRWVGGELSLAHALHKTGSGPGFPRPPRRGLPQSSIGARLQHSLKKKTQERQSQTCPRASGLPAAGRGRLWLAPHDPLAGQLPRLLGAPEASLWELHHVYGAHQVQRLLAPASVTVQSPGTACPSGLGPRQETAVPVGDTHTSALQPRLREPGLGDTSACAVPQEASGNPLLPPS